METTWQPPRRSWQGEEGKRGGDWIRGEWRWRGGGGDSSAKDLQMTVNLYSLSISAIDKYLLPFVLFPRNFLDTRLLLIVLISVINCVSNEELSMFVRFPTLDYIMSFRWFYNFFFKIEKRLFWSFSRYCEGVSSLYFNPRGKTGIAFLIMQKLSLVR